MRSSQLAEDSPDSLCTDIILAPYCHEPWLLWTAHEDAHLIKFLENKGPRNNHCYRCNLDHVLVSGLRDCLSRHEWQAILLRSTPAAQICSQRAHEFIQASQHRDCHLLRPSLRRVAPGRLDSPAHYARYRGQCSASVCPNSICSWIWGDIR